jgi:histidinol phosphatase-like enzyme (inositol monophosphatase family)
MEESAAHPRDRPQSRRKEILVTKSQRPGLPALIAFAHALADLSGAAILPYFRRPIPVKNKAGKGGFDPVTVADRSAERAISRALAKHWPEHGLEGEEFGCRHAPGGLRWVVDPIDGTRAFILGLPVWGTLIGLMDGDTPLFGMMDQPYTRERFWSGVRASFFCGPDGKQRRLKCRACNRLGHAMLSATHPDMFGPGVEQHAFATLKARARATRYGGDCYAYCMLAAGHIDVIVEAGLKAHDVVALIPIVERAGGCITTWEGNSAASGGRIVATGDPRLHEEVLRSLA